MTMDNARKISRWSNLLIIACAVLCFAIGYAAARWLNPASVATPTEISEPDSTQVHLEMKPVVETPALA